MIPVKQEIYDPVRGDCLRAAAASLLELPLNKVPNFAGLFPEDIGHFGWFQMFYYWLHFMGYSCKGWYEIDQVGDYDGIKDHAIVSVQSLNFESCSHACIYSLQEKLIVHDPDKNNLALKRQPLIEGFYWINERDS